MQPVRQSRRLSNTNKNNNIDSNIVSSSRGYQNEPLKKNKRTLTPSSDKTMEQVKKPKTTNASAQHLKKRPTNSTSSDKETPPTKKSKITKTPGAEFQPNTRMHSNSNKPSESDVEFANNKRAKTMSSQKKNNGKNVSRFESPSPVQKMKERIITTVKDVNPMISNMSIKGRCISVWHSHKLNENHDPYSLDCVFQDIESNRIQITIKKELMFKFEPLLREGQCYIFSNFGVAENSGTLPLLPHRWKISFYKGTEVTRVEQIDENIIGFVNEPFSRILDTSNQYHNHDSVDVIGTVVSIGNIVQVNGYGCSKVRRTVVIEDARSLRLECTFWDKWALMWNEYADKLDEIHHLDFILILGKIKYWNNKPAIHNALFGTKILINKDISPLRSFRKSYEANTGFNESEFKIETHKQETKVITPAEFMQGSLRKMVGMIRDIEPETYCVVYATIHSIQYEKGWAYTGCKKCNTKVNAIPNKGPSTSRNQKQLWHCKKHGETYAVVSRFKIIVRIFDESGSAQVIIFDNNVNKMTNLSAWEIMEKQGMDANQYFPDELNQIIGKQYLFKIKYTEFNHNNNSHVYRAEKVTEDVETIEYFKNGLVKYEDEDEEYEDEDEEYETCEMNEDDEDDNQSENNDEEEDNQSENSEANENEKHDHTFNSENHAPASPTVDINENIQNALENSEKTTTNENASEAEKEHEIVYIDLSDYETEDEEENLDKTNKLVKVKLEKNAEN